MDTDIVQNMDHNDPDRSVRLDDVRALGGHFRNDANAIHFQNELEHVIQKTYEYKLRGLQIANGEVLPIRSTIPRGLKSWTYSIYEPKGYAIFFTSQAWKDIPRADVVGKKVTGTVHEYGVGYGYTLGDLEQSRITGKNIEAMRGQAAKRAFDQLVEQTAVRGNDERNLLGIANLPNMTVMTSPAGTGGATKWTTLGATAKTATEVLADLNSMVDTMLDLTKQIHRPTAFYMPQSERRRLQLLKLGTGKEEKSVYNAFLEDNPEVKKIGVLHELETSAANAGPCILAFEEDPESMWLEQPIPFEQHGPFQDGLEYGVATRGSTAGVICVYPLSVIRMDFGST